MNITHHRLIDLVAAELFGKELTPTLFDGMSDQEWNQLFNLASPHNVQAIVWDSITHHLPERLQPPKLLKIAWIATSQNIEKRYKARIHVIADIAKLFQENGMEMMLLKGAGLASFYPIPPHRQFSDIDFHVSDFKKADKLISEMSGAKISNSFQHHTTCSINGILLENHYDFIICTHKSSVELEKKLKVLAKDGTMEEFFIEGQRIILPPATFNAIFLIRHASAHWAAEELSLKSICDWGLFLQHQSNNIDYEVFHTLLKQYNMHQFADAIDTILVEWMGLDSKYVKDYNHQKSEEQLELAEKVFDELIAPAFPHYNPRATKNPIRSIAFRTRRFFANKWKHDICYSDSFLSAFIYSSFSHIRKPKTILR